MTRADRIHDGQRWFRSSLHISPYRAGYDQKSAHATYNQSAIDAASEPQPPTPLGSKSSPSASPPQPAPPQRGVHCRQQAFSDAITIFTFSVDVHCRQRASNMFKEQLLDYSRHRPRLHCQRSRASLHRAADAGSALHLAASAAAAALHRAALHRTAAAALHRAAATAAALPRAGAAAVLHRCHARNFYPKFQTLTFLSPNQEYTIPNQELIKLLPVIASFIMKRTAEIHPSKTDGQDPSVHDRTTGDDDDDVSGDVTTGGGSGVQARRRTTARRHERRAPARRKRRGELTGDQNGGGRSTDGDGVEEEAAATFGLTTMAVLRRSTATMEGRTRTATRRRPRRRPSRATATTRATTTHGWSDGDDGGARSHGARALRAKRDEGEGCDNRDGRRLRPPQRRGRRLRSPASTAPWLTPPPSTAPVYESPEVGGGKRLREGTTVEAVVVEAAATSTLDETGERRARDGEEGSDERRGFFRGPLLLHSTRACAGGDDELHGAGGCGSEVASIPRGLFFLPYGPSPSAVLARLRPMPNGRTRDVGRPSDVASARGSGSKFGSDEFELL
uniref:Uncharacterized protein n=1 Tax=Oryza sativa subsp. japonica TaxID=39947 RepID=Q65XG7_ORYSJ|nr:hypothetical protein [Oryza sativa Japonica Group]